MTRRQNDVVSVPDAPQPGRRPKQVSLDLRKLAIATDASHFSMRPSGVISIDSVAGMSELLSTHAKLKRPVTFRSGGTSLSGQGVTEHVLIDTRQSFRGLEVLDGGAKVRVRPGSTVRSVNQRLAPYGFRLGPDPASEIAATIGGVIANNSSGMLCGTRDNAYQTLESLVVVLASGNIIDSSLADADERLRSLEPGLHSGLLNLREQQRGVSQGDRTTLFDEEYDGLLSQRLSRF